jgi:hypothetical protein
MHQSLRIRGLTDLDRLTLEDEFDRAGMGQVLSFDEPSKAAGGAGLLEPLSATVAVTAMTLTVLAIWICLTRRKDTKIELESTGQKVTITTSETTECKAEVLAQLSRLFPNVVRSTS